jgi:hypothetical protein
MRHPVDSRRWASTAPDHVEAFSNDVSKLPAAADGYRLAIHGSLESTGTVLAADPVFVRVSRFKGVRSLSHVRSLGHSTTLGGEAAGGLGSDQSTSAFPEYLCMKSFSVGLPPQETGRTATRQLANRRVHRFFGAENIRVEL